MLTLEEPLNIFPKLLAMPVAAILPASVPSDFDQHPTGSGPWRFVSWSHDDQIVLAKNPRYWNGAAAHGHAPDPDHPGAAHPRGGVRGGTAERGGGAVQRDEAVGRASIARSWTGGPRSATSTSRSTPPAGRSRTRACAGR